MNRTLLGRIRGFTLIELLVVIAIIGVLSAIIISSVNIARTNARDAKRVAQLAEVRKALELYYSASGRYAYTNEVRQVVAYFLPHIREEDTRFEWFSIPVAHATCFLYGPDATWYAGTIESELSTYIKNFVAEEGSTVEQSNYSYTASEDGKSYCLGIELERAGNIPGNNNSLCVTGAEPLSLGLSPSNGYAIGDYAGGGTLNSNCS